MNKKEKGRKRMSSMKKAAQALNKYEGKEVASLSPKELSEIIQILCQLLGLADENGKIEL